MYRKYRKLKIYIYTELVANFIESEKARVDIHDVVPERSEGVLQRQRLQRHVYGPYGHIMKPNTEGVCRLGTF